MRATEFIVEYRNRLLQYVKSLLPTWPEYVLKDWLVPNKGDFSNLPPDAIKNGIMEKVQGAGLTANSKWQLIPDMKFTMDMFEPKTKQRLIGRAGGSSDLGMGIPKDKERHVTQAALAQQQGGVRKEPVLLIKSANGYELLEGWHRTIQHFHKFPDGYTGPAYVTVAQGQQGLAEGIEDNYNKNDAGIKATLQAGVKLIPIQSNNHATGKPIYIHDYSGRYTVLVDMGGISVPYYVSTGLGGKAGVAVDKWYPFFGIGSDGWINKGSEANINDFYGSNKLKRVAQVLNNTLGLPSRAKNVSGWPGNRGDENYFISAVNRGLDPAPRSDHSTKIRDNMLSVLLRLGEPNKYVEKASPTQATRPKGIVFDKNNPEHVASFNATSQSERELATALAKEPKGVA